jgi:dihydroorotate dehydrogenase (NAD+) catalytic subunit
MTNRKHNNRLGVDIGGVRLKNPVMTASGTFGYGKEFDELIDLNQLGGIVVKGLSLQPSPGNPPPRIIETPCGMLNAIGLENIGIEAFVTEKLPFLRNFSTPIFINIYGKTVEEYSVLAARIDELDDIAGLEVNISCPNVKSGGVAFGVDCDAAAQVVESVRQHTSKPLMVKLSPNVTDIVEIAKSVEGAGADSVSLINTITGMMIDIDTRKPILANITGGLSGPAIKPVALRMVWQVAREVKIPVIGIGGVMTAEDAIAFLIAGASAVQVGTANFVNPRVTIDIIEGLEGYLDHHNINHIDEVIGTLAV